MSNSHKHKLQCILYIYRNIHIYIKTKGITTEWSTNVLYHCWKATVSDNPQLSMPIPNRMVHVKQRNLQETKKPKDKAHSSHLREKATHTS